MKRSFNPIILSLFLFNCFMAAENRAAPIPKPDHIVIAILENHAYTQIIGSSSAPYINALSGDSLSALFTHSYAIEHPSQPNYLDLYSCGNQGITTDNVPAVYPFTTANMGRVLIDSGKTF